WLLGYSHRGPAADKMIRNRFADREAVADVCLAYLSHGIDAIMAPIDPGSALDDGLKMAEQRAGRRIIRIDTPIINVDDTRQGRDEARAVIRKSRDVGAAFCLPHHSSVEQLVCKNTQTINRLPDYLSMIREDGMIPGLSAHMPELIVFSDLNEYDVETYVQIYNCMGFLMQVEIEYIHSVIHGAKKPVMSIKPMAAGRVTPFVGITFAFATLRPCDMVTVGCHTPDEVHEDVEIALAALERRKPDLEGRASPNKTPIMHG
ncbi:MAG: hypothetical protein FWG37_03695, partial [Clostridia bacterium]|nr:hypothetical protein [Clostridia bacterium]